MKFNIKITLMTAIVVLLFVFSACKMIRKQKINLLKPNQEKKKHHTRKKRQPLPHLPKNK